MTQYIYLASPVKLPGGSFGANQASSEQPNIFQTELDFTHLSFENNYDRNLKRKFSYSPHFSFDCQVAAYSNFIPLKPRLRGTAEEEKCLRILYDYLEAAMQESGIIEYFTCLSGKEDSPISKKQSVRWKDMKDGYDLVIEDREFWEITI